MEAILFLAADYANHEATGKLNILGVFNRILATEFPIKHKRLYLVIRIAAGLGEHDTQHRLKIVLYDEDAQEMGAQEGIIRFAFPKGGRQAEADLILEIADLTLPKRGRYEFKLIINQDVKATLPLDVDLLMPNTEQ